MITPKELERKHYQDITTEQVIEIIDRVTNADIPLFYWEYVDGIIDRSGPVPEVYRSSIKTEQKPCGNALISIPYKALKFPQLVFARAKIDLNHHDQNPPLIGVKNRAIHNIGHLNTKTWEDCHLGTHPYSLRFTDYSIPIHKKRATEKYGKEGCEKILVAQERIASLFEWI